MTKRDELNLKIEDLVKDEDMNKHVKNLAIMTSVLEMMVKTFNNEVFNGDFKYSLNKINLYASALFDYSKFKKHQLVQLGNNWSDSISKDSSGWSHCSHFMKRGAVVEIVKIDYREDGFIYDCIFKDESWIPKIGENKGIPQPVIEPGTFSLREDWLEEIPDKKTETYVLRLKDEKDGWIFLSEIRGDYPILGKFRDAFEYTKELAEETLEIVMASAMSYDFEIVPKSVAAYEYFSEPDLQTSVKFEDIPMNTVFVSTDNKKYIKLHNSWCAPLNDNYLDDAKVELVHKFSFVESTLYVSDELEINK